MKQTISRAYGTQYQVEVVRASTRNSRYSSTSLSVRRVGPRPVDILRDLRAARKESK